MRRECGVDCSATTAVGGRGVEGKSSSSLARFLELLPDGEADVMAGLGTNNVGADGVDADGVGADGVGVDSIMGEGAGAVEVESLV